MRWFGQSLLPGCSPSSPLRSEQTVRGASGSDVRLSSVRLLTAIAQRRAPRTDLWLKRREVRLPWVKLEQGDASGPRAAFDPLGRPAHSMSMLRLAGDCMCVCTHLHLNFSHPDYNQAANV